MEQAGWLRSDYLSEDEIARERAHSLGVPFVLLTREDIAPEALVMIPEPLSRTHSAAAYAMGGGVLEVAFVNLDALEKVQELYPHIKIRPRLTNQASIKQALLLYQKHLKEKFGMALQAGQSEALIMHALMSQASDIHLDVLPEGTRVRYRIGGVLHDAMRLTAEAGAGIVRGIKSVAKLFPIAVAQTGKFKIEHEEGMLLVSVANVAAVHGEKLTLRLSSEHASTNGSAKGFTLSALGLHGQALERVHTMLHQRGGLMLVSGKSESGKTTTLYTLLDQIRGAHMALATIEENIEHEMPYATQTQIKPELGLTMLAGLRSVLRTDPDVVMIGAIDSAEVAEVALEAAARGVLVLGAIDARSAAGAIDKLLSWELAPALVARALRGVIAQKLVKKLDTQREKEQLTREYAAKLEQRANFARVLAPLKEEGHIESHVAWKDVAFYEGDEGSGLSGIQEVLPVTHSIKEMILQSADAEDIESQARKEGMLTLAEDALFKAAAGVISLKTAVEVASV